MKVFLSWSGKRSLAVAELMQEWIPNVIQSVKPWVSSENIKSGDVWFTAIADTLSDCGLGIVFLTQTNKNKPWILFEAGALAKGARGVCTFLVDLKNSDIEPPLSSFNHTDPSRESVWKLIRKINETLGDAAVEKQVLRSAFEVNWDRFALGFEQILSIEADEEPAQARDPESVISEILTHTRELATKINDMERKLLRPDPIPGTADEWEQRMTDGLVALVKQGVGDAAIIESMGLKGWEGKYKPLLSNIRSYNKIPNPDNS